MFRMEVQEKHIAPGGRHVEVVGSYDPHKKVTQLKADRIQYWLTQGAQPSDTAYNILVREGIIEGKKRAVKIEKPAIKEDGSTEGTEDATQK